MKKKYVIGKVIKKNFNKTITILIKKKVKHNLYKKYINKNKKLHVHDENNNSSIGDIVKIIQCRPLSKKKHWKIFNS